MHAHSSTPLDSPVFIVNPRAGRFRRNPRLLSAIFRAVGARGSVFATGTLAELHEAAEAAVTSRGPVVLCGGDGTYLASVSALVSVAAGRSLPQVVLAEGGTVSIVAKNWGGYPDILTCVRAVVERPGSLRFVSRPTIAATDSLGTRRVGFTFGTGLVANFFSEYERGGARGNPAAAMIALRTLAHAMTGGPYAAKILSPLPCRITVDGRTLGPDAFSLVVMSVLRNVGLHFLVTYRAAEDPERPHLVASSLAPRALAPQWFRVARGLPLLGQDNFDDLVRECRLDFPTDDGAYVLDGDTFRTRSVTIQAGPLLRVATRDR